MANVLISLLLILIVGNIVYFLYKAKKRGQHCIGCPYSGQCGKKSCSSRGEE